MDIRKGLLVGALVLAVPMVMVDGPRAAADDDQVAAAAAAAEEAEVNDPIEPVNRAIFEFNEGLQVLLLRPAATLYKAFTPPPVREAVGNAMDNLSTSVTLSNDLFQAEWERAWQTTERFFINSTYGVGGLVDRAAEMGIPKHTEDFGQTLAVWGVGEGFYLVLPLFGPSNPRDAVGKLGVDPFLDGFGWYLKLNDEDAGEWARTVVNGVNEYAGVVDELDQVRKTSVDYYAAIRSMYRQKRAAEIRNGAQADLPPIPDLTYEFEDDGSVGQLTR